MKRLLPFFFLLGFCTPGKTCVNTYDHTLHGGHIDAYGYHLEEVLENEQRKKNKHELLEDFYERHRFEWKDEFASDYAALLILDLQLEKAKIILDTLLQKDSMNYSYNSNYGTLMELMGNNRAALKFIQRSVNIDSESHNGSEWIHVRILEAKIKMQANKNWITHHHVLGDDLTKKHISHILYQLEERTYFIQPKDPIVCDLFFTLGQLSMQYDQGVILARKAYTLSLEYGSQYQAQCHQQLFLLSFFPDNYYDEDNPLSYLSGQIGVLLCISLVILVIVSAIRKTKRKKINAT